MWSLYSNESGKEEYLKPLIFSNGKSQEDVVKEVLEAIDNGNKVIFIKGVCGTGKSAIALNLAKEIGKASVVVPIKNLQKQYEEDYTNKKFILKDKRKLKMKVMTGRSNHKCLYMEENPEEFQEERTERDSQLGDFGDYRDVRKFSKDISCNNNLLPCKIQIKDKNSWKIYKYLKKNPKVNVRNFSDTGINRVRRMSIAPICPYWSPIVPSEIDLGLEANHKYYEGLRGTKFTIYQRKPGCGYYDQFDECIDADIIIFNSHKYKLESLMDRKPLTEVEIIDECDEFLDSFSNDEKINLNRLNYALRGLFAENEKIDKIIDEMVELVKSILKDEEIDTYIAEEKILALKDTKIFPLLEHFFNSEILKYVECDDENYCYHVDEVARIFKGFFNETYVSFYRDERDVIAKLVTTDLEKKFKELLDKNKILVLMSGTIHSERVLKDIFGISEFKIIEAETKTPGRITELKTGSEINCKYDNFQRGLVTREDYLKALDNCIKRAERPVLIHVNSFKDLPSEKEINEYELNVMSRDRLRKLQSRDSVGEQANKFKKGDIDVLYSTKCNRGVDFPGSVCNSIILTRYPYPNISSLFWRILRMTRPQYYNEFYMDKSRREFLQKIYRGLRSENDHIFLLSPDSRVFGG